MRHGAPGEFPAGIHTGFFSKKYPEKSSKSGGKSSFVIKKARREEADAIRKILRSRKPRWPKNARALMELSKKRNEFPVMLYMNSDELYIVVC